MSIKKFEVKEAPPAPASKPLLDALKDMADRAPYVYSFAIVALDMQGAQMFWEVGEDMPFAELIGALEELKYRIVVSSQEEGNL